MAEAHFAFDKNGGCVGVGVLGVRVCVCVYVYH
jgi:hypothetical protein